MLSISTRASVVVEGPSDTVAVHRILDCVTIETLGMDVDAALPDIRKARALGQVVIMTDSDPSGERIRAYIHERVGGCLDARVVPENGKKRATVERASAKEIIRALRAGGAELTYHLSVLCNRTLQVDSQPQAQHQGIVDRG